MTISVVLATHNEEKNLARCLNSVREFASEIVVVDGESEDKTVSIARKFGAKVIETENLQMFHINKQKAIEMAKSDWIFQLDADEEVTPGLRDEVISTVNDGSSADGYWVPRSNYFLGRFLKKGGAYPDYTLRIYRNGLGHLPCKSVHEQAVVKGKIGKLKNDLLHYSDPTFSRYLERFNRYTDLQSKNLKGGFMKNFILAPLFDSKQGFVTIYFRHLGILDGFPGFVWALFSALNFPISYLKKKNN